MCFRIISVVRLDQSWFITIVRIVSKSIALGIIWYLALLSWLGLDLCSNLDHVSSTSCIWWGKLTAFAQPPERPLVGGITGADGRTGGAETRLVLDDGWEVNLWWAVPSGAYPTNAVCCCLRCAVIPRDLQPPPPASLATVSVSSLRKTLLTDEVDLLSDFSLSASVEVTMFRLWGKVYSTPAFALGLFTPWPKVRLCVTSDGRP